MRGQVKVTWGKLTDDDLTQIDGQRDKLIGKLEERYGYSKMEAEREVENFMRSAAHSDRDIPSHH
ncbi:MAG TPA: CsbD family protein [Anaerolineales bacterium]